MGDMPRYNPTTPPSRTVLASSERIVGLNKAEALPAGDPVPEAELEASRPEDQASLVLKG